MVILSAKSILHIENLSHYKLQPVHKTMNLYHWTLSISHCTLYMSHSELQKVLDRSPSTSMEYKNVPQSADVQKP